MKFFILLAVVASAVAVPYAGIVNTGSSAVSRSEDGHGNYAFGYNEDHATGGTFRKEKGGPGVQVGSYGLRDADGRIRTVNYVADALGFRASISTNEPGVDPHQSPAAASVNGALASVPAVPVLSAPLAVAAPVAYGAPLVAKSWAAAPVAIAAPLGSSYSVATQHVSAAPVAIAAPLITKSYAAAPLAIAAPLASSYSVQTSHASVPLLTKSYAAPLLASSWGKW